MLGKADNVYLPEDSVEESLIAVYNVYCLLPVSAGSQLLDQNQNLSRTVTKKNGTKQWDGESVYKAFLLQTLVLVVISLICMNVNYFDSANKQYVWN